MKRIVSLLLIACICVLALPSCELLSSLPGLSDKDPYSGMYLLEKITSPSDGGHEVVFAWGENTCSYTVGQTELLFTYAEETRTLTAEVTNDGEKILTLKYGFDEEGRAVSVGTEETTILAFSYDEHGTMTVTECTGTTDFTPVEITVDRENFTAPMAPFNDPENTVTFTEYGDLVGGGDTTLCSFAYDENGNIQTISMGEESITCTYGSEALTETWQRIPLKIMLAFLMNWPYSVLAIDVMCMSLQLGHKPA